jgi:hypothetical protein
MVEGEAFCNAAASGAGTALRVRSRHDFAKLRCLLLPEGGHGPSAHPLHWGWPTDGRLGFAIGADELERGTPMIKIAISAALFGFGVVGLGASFPQWIGHQPCTESSCVIGP